MKSKSFFAFTFITIVFTTMYFKIELKSLLRRSQPAPKTTTSHISSTNVTTTEVPEPTSFSSNAVTTTVNRSIKKYDSNRRSISAIPKIEFTNRDVNRLDDYNRSSELRIMQLTSLKNEMETPHEISKVGNYRIKILFFLNMN